MKLETIFNNIINNFNKMYTIFFMQGLIIDMRCEAK